MRARELLTEYKVDVTKQRFGNKLFLSFIKELEREAGHRGGRTPSYFDFASDWTDSEANKSVVKNNRALRQAGINPDLIIKAIKEKDTSTVIDAILKILEMADPTPNKQYVPWLASQYSKSQFIDTEGNINLEDYISTIKEYLVKFDKLKNKKLLQHPRSDILKYDYLVNFMNVMDEYPDVHKDTAKMSKGQAKEVYKDGDLRIIVPEDKEAACYYGQGTRWCTAATRGGNMFDEYAESGKMYIIIPTKPSHPGEKYQFHFEEAQFMDERDEPINYEMDEYGRRVEARTLAGDNLVNRFPQLSKIFEKQIKATGNGLWLLSLDEEKEWRRNTIKELQSLAKNVNGNNIILLTWYIFGKIDKETNKKNKEFFNNAPIGSIEPSLVRAAAGASGRSWAGVSALQNNNILLQPAIHFLVTDKKWYSINFIALYVYTPNKASPQFGIIDIQQNVDVSEISAYTSDVLDDIRHDVRKINQALMDEKINIKQAWDSIMNTFVDSDLAVEWPQPEASRAPSPDDEDPLYEETNMESLDQRVQNLMKKYSESHIMDQLKKGIKVEMEHSPVLRVALQIAVDHLEEDPSYYTALEKVGLHEGEVIPFKPKRTAKYRKSDIEIPLYDRENNRSVLPQYASGNEEPFERFVAAQLGKNSTKIIGITKDGKEITVSTLGAPLETGQVFVDAMNRGGFSRTSIERVPLGEIAGRITKQNQTMDVGPNEITKQAKKFGNQVNRDGYPPLLREGKKKKKAKKRSKKNYGLVGGLWPSDVAATGFDGGDGGVSEAAKEHPWGHSPPHDIKKLFADKEFIQDLAAELGKMKRMNPMELRRIDRGVMVRNLLNHHNYKDYPRLVQMLLQLIKSNLK